MSYQYEENGTLNSVFFKDSNTTNMATKKYSASFIISSTLISIIVLLMLGSNHSENIASLRSFSKTASMLGDGKQGVMMKSCSDSDYRKRTIKALKDDSFFSLFSDSKGQKKFEASDVIVVDGHYYSICDSNWSIQKIDSSVTSFSKNNKQIGNPSREGEEGDSGYEGIFHIDGIFYLVRESVNLNDGDDKDNYHSVVEEVYINEDETDYTIGKQCISEIEFDGKSKGFEGAVGMKSADGTLYIMGLCEGNFCTEGSKGQTRGNGKVVIMKRKDSLTNLPGGYDCQWQTVRVIDLPKSANFKDYSAIAINKKGEVAITSQEDSQVWISSLTNYDSNTNTFDPLASEFDDKNAKVYDFPRDGGCDVVYCNIEGIHWYGEGNKNVLVGVSDKMKSAGKQDYRCQEKDQSLHFFNLP